jgi:integrase/recombinase XerD
VFGYRTLAITGKGGKKAVIPLAPRTGRAIDLAIGERCEGPIFTSLAAAAGPSRRRADRPPGSRRAGLPKKVGPHTLRQATARTRADR